MAVPENTNVIRYILTHLSPYTPVNTQSADKREGFFCFQCSFEENIEVITVGSRLFFYNWIIRNTCLILSSLKIIFIFIFCYFQQNTGLGLVGPSWNVSKTIFRWLLLIYNKSFLFQFEAFFSRADLICAITHLAMAFSYYRK